MKRSYLVGPCLAMFACWTYGNGVVPLLPQYVMQRGASPAGAGLLLGFLFLCVALGTGVSALLPRGFAHRRFLLGASGAFEAAATWYLGQAPTLTAFVVAEGSCFFMGGIQIAQAATLVGLSAPPAERGTAFGILGMTNGLGGLAGGLGIGYLADRWGPRVTFECIGVFYLLVVAGALLSAERAQLPHEAPGREPGHPVRPGQSSSGSGLAPLLAGQLLLAVAVASGNLGRSLSMDQRSFSRLTVDLTASISGLVTLGLPPLLGWLSDRVQRRGILGVAFLVSSASIVTLAFSREPWHFYGFAVLSAFSSIPFSIGPAFVLDVVPPRRAARAVSVFQGMFWAGNIAGMAASGVAFERLGTSVPLLFAAALPAASALLLLLLVRPQLSLPPRGPSPARRRRPARA